MKCVLKHQDLQMFGFRLNKYRVIFHQLEIVGRGSDTQLQVGENLERLNILQTKNYIALQPS